MRYTIQERQWQGVEVWELQTEQAVARISRFGGQLLSWQPAGEQELLWCSERLQPPTPLRGGIPVCWPWFGKHPCAATAPSHGLARTVLWQLMSCEALTDGRVRLCLTPSVPLHVALQVKQQLTIGLELEQSLITHNNGTQALPLSQALHSYFRVADIASIQVQGLDGTHYLDALVPGETFGQDGPWHFDPDRHDGRCDRIHLGVNSPVVLEDPLHDRRIQIHADGGHALVVWTPGPVLAAQMPDVGEQWSHYLCLEVANVASDARVLAAGQSHRLSQRIRLLP